MLLWVGVLRVHGSSWHGSRIVPCSARHPRRIRSGSVAGGTIQAGNQATAPARKQALASGRVLRTWGEVLQAPGALQVLDGGCKLAPGAPCQLHRAARLGRAGRWSTELAPGSDALG